MAAHVSRRPAANLAEAAVPMDTADDSISCLICTPRPWFPVVVIGQPLARNLQLIRIMSFQQNCNSSLLVTVDSPIKFCWSSSNIEHVGLLAAHSDSKQDTSMRNTVTWLVSQDLGCITSKWKPLGTSCCVSAWLRTGQTAKAATK